MYPAHPAFMDSNWPSLGLVVADKVYLSFQPLRTANALLFCCGEIIATGSRERIERAGREVGEALGVKPWIEEYREAVVIPGFVDAHAHIGGLGFSLTGIDLRGAKSIEEFKERIRREVDRFSDWVYGRGWDQEEMGAWPTRWDVDEAVGNRPAVFVRICGHVAVLSTAALKRLGLEEYRGRELDRGCDGTPTGLVYEGLVPLVLEEVKKGLDAAPIVAKGLHEMLKNGVTLVGDMDVGSKWLGGLLGLYSSPPRPLPRIRIYLRLNVFEKLERLGVKAPLGNGFLKIVGVKAFADGALGPRTAFLREPYADDETTRGILLLDRRKVAELASRAQGLGYDVAIHAIGDAALDEVLEGYRAAGCRCRVEHASIAHREQIEAIAKLGLRVAVQPHFLVSDSPWLLSRLGARVERAYPFREMLEKGVVLGFSSDAPVEPVNPLLGVAAAVRHPRVEERLSVLEALYLYTRGSAMVLGEEKAGCLEPGCFADMAVLDRDPVESSPEELGDIRVIASHVSGAKAWP